MATAVDGRGKGDRVRSVERVVEPELLDSLPVNDPEAERNRRDLTLLNALMGSHRWLDRTLRAETRPGDRVLELGAGKGELLGRMRKRWADSVGVHLSGLDRWPAPEGWPVDAEWWQEDALAFPGYDRYNVVAVNLLLHQFEDAELAQLGQRLDDGPRLIVACEPARRWCHLAQLKFVGLFGLGRVTRHDGAVSIRAGFLGEELPQLLRLDRHAWSWRCETGLRGQYFMVARRMIDR